MIHFNKYTFLTKIMFFFDKETFSLKNLHCLFQNLYDNFTQNRFKKVCKFAQNSFRSRNFPLVRQHEVIRFFGKP